MANKWVIKQGDSIIHEEENDELSYNFTDNTSESDITYTVITTKDDGCTASTTVTVPSGDECGGCDVCGVSDLSINVEVNSDSITITDMKFRVYYDCWSKNVDNYSHPIPLDAEGLFVGLNVKGSFTNLLELEGFKDCITFNQNELWYEMNNPFEVMGIVLNESQIYQDGFEVSYNNPTKYYSCSYSTDFSAKSSYEKAFIRIFTGRDNSENYEALQYKITKVAFSDIQLNSYLGLNASRVKADYDITSTSVYYDCENKYCVYHHFDLDKFCGQGKTLDDIMTDLLQVKTQSYNNRTFPTTCTVYMYGIDHTSYPIIWGEYMEDGSIYPIIIQFYIDPNGIIRDRLNVVFVGSCTSRNNENNLIPCDGSTALEDT